MFFGDDKIFTDDEARRCMARVDGTLAELVCVQSDFLMMSWIMKNLQRGIQRFLEVWSVPVTVNLNYLCKTRLGFVKLKHGQQVEVCVHVDHTLKFVSPQILRKIENNISNAVDVDDDGSMTTNINLYL